MIFRTNLNKDVKKDKILHGSKNLVYFSPSAFRYFAISPFRHIAILLSLPQQILKK